MRPNLARSADHAKAGSGTGLGDQQLGGNPVAHLRDVADNADRAAALAQGVEDVENVVEGLGIERPEALVDEQRLQVGAARLMGDDVGKPEREGKRHDERLPARGGRRIAALARPVVANDEAEPATRLSSATTADVLQG